MVLTVAFIMCGGWGVVGPSLGTYFIVANPYSGEANGTILDANVCISERGMLSCSLSVTYRDSEPSNDQNHQHNATVYTIFDTAFAKRPVSGDSIEICYNPNNYQDAIQCGDILSGLNWTYSGITCLWTGLICLLASACILALILRLAGCYCCCRRLIFSPCC